MGTLGPTVGEANQPCEIELRAYYSFKDIWELQP